LIARKNGRRTVILSDDLRRWLQGLPVTNSKSVLTSQTADQLQGGA
jgi:hypothetical protein